MPKILINEEDFTTPGTPDSYTNYSVLIPGFQVEFTKDAMATAQEELARAEEAVANNKEPEALSADAKRLKARLAKADANGVYEFTSVADFEETIGETELKVVLKKDTGNEEIYHYGNQMARELLSLGYTVIYKVIDKNTVYDLAKEDTWAVFRDKASYDFRFVTHGLLASATNVPSVQEVLDEDEYEALVLAREELSAVDRAIGVLNQIKSIYNLPEKPEDATEEQVNEAADALKVNELLKEYNYENYYDTTSEIEGVSETTTGAANDLAQKRDNLEATIATYELKYAEAVKKVEDAAVTSDFINRVNVCIANLAKFTDDSASGRGDCVALIELDEKSYTGVSTQAPESRIINAINKLTGITEDNGKYCALTVPSVVYTNKKKFPGAFHYLACFMNSLRSGFREWYAAAGYTRGVSNYVVDRTTVKLGEIAINALEPRNIGDPQSDYPAFACNVIANFRGSYYLWGNRTACPLDTKASGGDLIASHFLNIRQLCATIKKQLYVACCRFTFDPNSDTLWFNFVNAIRPTLDEMKADQGIRDYKIMKVTTDKKATLKAKIRIIPIEAVEDFDLTVSLEDSFGETTAVVTE